MNTPLGSLSQVEVNSRCAWRSRGRWKGVVCVNEKDLVRKRSAMYHFPFTKLPALTGSTHVLGECARVEMGWGWTRRRGRKGNPEICNFKLGCTHKMHGGHQLVTYMGALHIAWKCVWEHFEKALICGEWHPVCHTGHANSRQIFCKSSVYKRLSDGFKLYRTSLHGEIVEELN